MRERGQELRASFDAPRRTALGVTTLVQEPETLEPFAIEEAEPEASPNGHLHPDEVPDEPERTVHIPLVVAAAALSALSAAWMTSRLFSQSLPALAMSIAGIAIGIGFIYLATRFERSALLLFAVLPAAVVVGAVLATTGEGAGLSLPALAADAIKGGGLLQPPIPFDPGWRLITVVLFAVVSSSACLLGVTFARPKLAAGVPLPVALGTALLQPEGTELVASGVSIVLLVTALAIAYGADLAADGVSSRGFEARRLVRGTALLGGVMVALVLVAQTDVLFPETEKNKVIPPQKPPSPPPEPDRVLFSVESDNKGPWRVGVLDVYDDNAFMLPSIDPARVREVPDDGVVAPKRGETFEATFHINRVKGQTLIGAPNQVRISGVDLDMEYDPRTQVVKLAERSVPRGFTYSVEAPVLPDANALAEAPAPTAAIQRDFTALPPAPPGVQQLLTKADLETTNKFERLQFVRNALYTNVVAAGGGRPVDVPPLKVDAMLAGGEASPYEISAAEVMLARWAGIPARLGFGFYGGEEGDKGLEFRPRHGAAWLEAYFEGHGWVPIVGTPPKAKASLSEENKKKEPEVRPTDELALTIYLPVRRPSLRLLYETVRYYASIVIPVGLALVLLIGAYPAVLKALRTRRRLRWASEGGLVATVVVAYAELRDRCHDLNIGDVRHSPLEFLADVEDDREHRELAWLVTRAIWGDLARDLRVEDVEDAQEMSRSVMRRIDREQSGLNRILARTSRASLRDAWTDEIPNVWFRRRARLSLRFLRPARLWRAIPLLGRQRRLAGATAVVLAFGMVLAGCGREASAAAPATYPKPLMPATIDGYRIERQADIEGSCQSTDEALLITGCRMYTVRDQEDAVQASIQVAVFKTDVDTMDWDVQRGVEGDLGTREAFRTHRYGAVRVRSFQAAEQQFFLWFPPGHNAMELFNFRKAFGDAELVVRAVIRHQLIAPADAPEPPTAEPVVTTPTVVIEGAKQ